MSLTIVMYHYVRDLARSRFPLIKGRNLEEFKGQIDYIEDHYTVMTAEQIVASINHNSKLPDNAAWLTFDDGYSDHFTNVFPLLYERGLQGSFFPPSNTVLLGELLDVNKVHFILAAEPDVKKIILEIKVFLKQIDYRDHVREFAEYWKELAHASRFDPAEIIFVKRILQHALPEDLRNFLTTQLFHKFVSTDMKAFAAELYMSVEQIKTMVSSGMYFGSHGANHYWMDRLTPEQQLADIDSSLDFLHMVGAPLSDWIMCYPYGSHNKSLHDLLLKRGCAAALTARVAVWQILTIIYHTRYPAWIRMIFQFQYIKLLDFIMD